MSSEQTAEQRACECCKQRDKEDRVTTFWVFIVFVFMAGYIFGSW